MGRLTEDMTNLRDEIDVLRNRRVEFVILAAEKEEEAPAEDAPAADAPAKSE